ncbi:MAG TPA: acetylornithine deacetylase, partial [Planctomycetaceae bacterium]|nr:acetylornithine deacetylase [Planctomycetaceae bacterium]
MTALEYAQELIRFKTISTDSNVAIAEYLQGVLERMGFETEWIEYERPEGVRKANVVGKKGGGRGGLAYFGHTDVVPADSWFSDEHGPFSPMVREGLLYGRGSCDMKGSVACMLAAAERFRPEELNEPIYVGLTADEEVGYYGAAEIAQRSRLFREMVEGQSRGIIGEPTELEVVYAHKGAYWMRATSRGRAAHSSTREGVNANLAMIPYLVEMKRIYDETETDPAWQNEEFDPPTICWNIGINDFTRALNITPAQSVCTVCFRPMPGQKVEKLIERARRAAETHGLEFELPLAAPPLYIDPDSEYVREVVRLAGKERPKTVSYGTDGTQFTELKRLVVIGPGSVAQAHTIDEWISLEQLERGTETYARFIRYTLLRLQLGHDLTTLTYGGTP